MNEEMEERLLPKEILNKSIKSGKEFGWRKEDFIETILAAKSIGLGIIGGQVQFVLPDGTCELYWLSYDSKGKMQNESWPEYCNRTAEEVISQFQTLCATTNFIQEGIRNFAFLKEKTKVNIDLNKYLTFIVYFIEEKKSI